MVSRRGARAEGGWRMARKTFIDKDKALVALLGTRQRTDEAICVPQCVHV